MSFIRRFSEADADGLFHDLRSARHFDIGPFCFRLFTCFVVSLTSRRGHLRIIIMVGACIPKLLQFLTKREISRPRSLAIEEYDDAVVS